jgi:hypothetical protein
LAPWSKIIERLREKGIQRKKIWNIHRLQRDKANMTVRKDTGMQPGLLTGA